ncbi:pilus assembly protein [Rhodobacteraceae bacterium NNCM2]|nr:pilus assembly protein [Coraliihabitans acroporae]
MIGALWDKAGAFWRDERGNATVEFVVLFPWIAYLVFMLAETGVLMARSVMLDRGLDIAMRDIRLGLTPDVEHDDIKSMICDAAFLIDSCESSVLLELVPITDPTSFPSNPISCVDRTEEVDPVTVFNPGAREQIMYVRACIIVDPLFPGSGLGAMLPKDASGGYAIVAKSAFVNEP